MSCRPTDVNSDLTQAELRLLFDYDPETGMLTRRVQTSSNAAAGCQAGYTNGGGYIRVGLHRRSYGAHRLIWLYVYGCWPAREIDHVNTCPSDNRLCNLREATRRQGLHNTSRRRDNRSGIKGVRWSQRHQRWVAKLNRPDGSVFQRRLRSKEAAAAAYAQEAARQFGEFARVE